MVLSLLLVLMGQTYEADLPPPLRLGVAPEFEFASPSGVGLPTVSALCSTFSTDDQTAPWGCIDTDGNNAGQLPDAGTFTWSFQDAGNPITRSSEPLCPNGPDCTAVTQDAFNTSNTSAAAGSGWATPTMPELGPAYTVCALVSVIADSNAGFGYQNIFSQAEGASVDGLWQVQSASLSVAVYVGNSVAYNVPAANITEGAWHLLCDVVPARGSATARFYVDGTDISGDHAAYAAGAFADQSIRFSGYQSGGFPLSAGTRFRGGFFTSEALSAGRIAAIARAVLADTPTGRDGEALVLSRGSPVFCPSSDGRGSIIPDSRPCVAKNGIRFEGSHTNVLQRGKELNNAYWGLASGGAPNPGNPTVTANAAKAPDGTWTAEQVDFGATTGTGYGVLYNVGGRTSTAASWSHGIWVKGVSGSGTIYLMSVTGATYNSTPCAFTSTDWSWCWFTGTETVATWYTQIGFDLRDAAQSGQGAQSVYLWGVQAQNSPWPSGFIPTFASSVTKNAERPYFAKSITTTAGGSVCMAATQTVPALAAYQAGAGLYAPMLSQASGSASSPYIWPYTAAAGSQLSVDAAGASGAPAGWAPGTPDPSLTARYKVGHNGTAWSICKNAVCAANSTPSSLNAVTYPYIKLDYAATSPDVGIWSNIQVGSSWARCTP